MKDSHKDHEMQKMLDDGYTPSGKENDTEMKLYQSLYKALERPPNLTIPQGFSQKVVAQAIQASDQRNYRLWLSSALAISLSLLLVGTVLYFTFPTSMKLIFSYAEVIGFAGLLFVAIQIADYKLVQRKVLFN